MVGTQADEGFVPGGDRVGTDGCAQGQATIYADEGEGDLAREVGTGGGDGVRPSHRRFKFLF